MGENSKIEWTHHTANLWSGCTKVHEGCDHCYAEALSHRFGNDVWGNDKPRLAVKSTLANINAWQKKAEKLGEVHRVFVGSMMDIFEKPMPLIDSKGVALQSTTGDLRRAFFESVVPASPNLMFLLLTKRPSNINKYIPEAWKTTPPANVIFGASPVNQETFDTLWLQLARVKGRRFLSIEPQLGEVQIKPYCSEFDILLDGFDSPACSTYDTSGIYPDWVIVGGESGPKRRPFDIHWGRSLMQQCRAAGIPFFFKQIDKIKQIPTDLMVREFPDDIDKCIECGKEMDETEHNYGTEDMLVCIHCYNDAQVPPAD